jgi:hypothetical protein
VARTPIDELEYCTAHNKCLDCHLEGYDTAAVKRQMRRTLNVPCCRRHLYAYKKKVNDADAKKYARASAQKRQARLCTYKGCHRKLIPQELLPPWIRESTCGLHFVIKAFRVNRASLLRLITEHCLTPEEREGMTAQNLVYRRGDGLVWFSARVGRTYITEIFSARSLLKLHEQLRQRTI